MTMDKCPTYYAWSAHKEGLCNCASHGKAAQILPYVLEPSTTGSALLAIDLFGRDAVDVGTWVSPVICYITKEEADAAKSLLAEKGVSITPQ